MLSATFSALQSNNERALVLFVTAGDPDLDSLADILAALEEGGADIIEVGLPFSDPIADGPTIQASSQRALDRGVTPLMVLQSLKRRTTKVPVVLMGYYNTILRYGLDQFAQMASDAGIVGTIVSDLTPEEAGPWVKASQQAALDTIFLVAPTSTDARIAEVAKMSSGFVYAVSRTGVTGASTNVAENVDALVRGIKAHTRTAVCVGFGISSPVHVKQVAQYADGVVVGSWLVDDLAKHWNHGAGRQELISKIKDLKAATRG